MIWHSRIRINRSGHYSLTAFGERACASEVERLSKLTSREGGTIGVRVA